MKYIETELKKRKGIVEHEEQKVKPKNAEDCLYELPENIRVSSAKKTEEMLSNQMLSGIPEVDLGIECVSRPGPAPPVPTKSALRPSAWKPTDGSAFLGRRRCLCPERLKAGSAQLGSLQARPPGSTSVCCFVSRDIIKGHAASRWFQYTA